MSTYDGTWLMIKDEHTYSCPELIEFKEGQVLHFELHENSENSILKKIEPPRFKEELAKTRYNFISDHRIRFYRKGTSTIVKNDNETITEESIFEFDHQRIEPTKTTLSSKEIQELEFEVVWNKEKIQILFNKELDNPAVLRILKKHKKEGRKIILEDFQSTLFCSFYNNGRRDLLVPIKEVDNDKIILYGFPRAPYEVIGKRINF
ncbi:hypothetical protein ACFQ1M_13630 [Sungkyunkwania multivorans]|uniref:Uncharacterized protein n=1 Tax=Sungkyunkwania multivorans TaxID=1173618 RepID=A0ABW3CZJ1_9FLAO